MRKRYYHVYMILLLMSVLGTSSTVFADAVPRMTVDELKSRLGTADVVVLDVRSGRDWNAADTKITGAVRANPGEVSQWSADFPKGKTIVLYCA